ncbi:MAG: hypothetical protein L3J61_04440 [Ghiorsea sp.]|nr:hypothetical protein [Ghiorsea sp.]
MKKILYTLSGFAMLAVSSVALVPSEAEAIPVFARKYGMTCNACHTMFPQLSKMGVAFRERGYRFEAGRGDIDSQDDRGKNFDASDNAVFAAAFPFTVRTQVLYSNAAPIEADTGGAVMPGHRPGMLDGAKDNAKIGNGEFGLISSGSYDNFSWWMDSSLLGGIGMLEGIYYVNDLVKVRFGRVQNNVGYGMTMMSKRPMGYGWADAAQMAGATMLMMVDGVSVHGTTNGDSGVGTYYNVSYGLAGNDSTSGNKTSTVYARVAQEIMDNHIVGAYTYKATNYTSDVFGGEAAMVMAMGAPGATNANPMAFSDVTRSGVDFAINDGEPLQAWGAYTVGNQTNPLTNTKLDVTAITLGTEWIMQEGWMFGAKYNSSKVDLQMLTNTVLKPAATTHTTLYGIHQVAENVQAILSYTTSKNVVERMGAGGGATNATLSDFNTFIFAIDMAL